MDLLRQHATVFVDCDVSGPVEVLRIKWDPVMASQIDAHFTLIYPDEVSGAEDLERRTALAAVKTAPFLVLLGEAFYVGTPAEGVFIHVHDEGGAIGEFRSLVNPPGRVVDFPPHVTIVHPRSSDRGEEAWAELADIRFNVRFVVNRVAITGFNGVRWQTLRAFSLGGSPHHE